MHFKHVTDNSKILHIADDKVDLALSIQLIIAFIKLALLSYKWILYRQLPSAKCLYTAETRVWNDQAYMFYFIIDNVLKQNAQQLKLHKHSN